MTVAEKRVSPAQACIDRFGGKPYEPGKRDCVRLAAHLLHHSGVKAPMMKGVRYSSEAAGLRILKRKGFANLIEAVDSLGLVRIAPARARTGDLVAMPVEEGDPFGCALTVAVGNGRVFGFLGGAERVAQTMQPHDFVAAWRVG